MLQYTIAKCAILGLPSRKMVNFASKKEKDRQPLVKNAAEPLKKEDADGAIGVCVARRNASDQLSCRLTRGGRRILAVRSLTCGSWGGEGHPERDADVKDLTGWIFPGLRSVPNDGKSEGSEPHDHPNQ